jgi:hypothetical protein
MGYCSLLSREDATATILTTIAWARLLDGLSIAGFSMGDLLQIRQVLSGAFPFPVFRAAPNTSRAEKPAAQLFCTRCCPLFVVDFAYSIVRGHLLSGGQLFLRQRMSGLDGLRNQIRLRCSPEVT